MDYIRKLPFIFGASMAIITGVVSLKNNIDYRGASARMSISMIVFFILGLYVKNIVEKIWEEVQKKKQEQENIKTQALTEKRELERKNADSADKVKTDNHKIDYKIDDFTDEFSPLKVSEIIKSKINTKAKNI